MSIGFISHPDCMLHDMGETHPECPQRLEVIEEEIHASGLNDLLKRYEAPIASRENLTKVHDEEYIEYLFKISPKAGLIPLDMDTWMNPYTLKAALHAAGSAILAVDLVMTREINAAFCSVRPPGHHAEKAKAMGFCFFNNVAVGVAHALTHYSLERVAIVDFDVHHGNGTEDIFKDDNRVMLCSSFQYPFYPMSGADTKSSHIINIPLPEGSTGKQFRAKIKELWLEPLKKFNPQMMFFSAGFDAHKNDILSGLLLDVEDYVWLTKNIKDIAENCCGGRMVSVLEGGYALNILGKCVAAHIRALMK